MKDLCLFIIALITVNSIAQTDFRGVSWGATTQMVLSQEDNNLISNEENKLIYEVSLGDINGTMMYQFTSSNKLMSGKYFLTPDYVNSTFYIRDYELFQDLLTQKYGQPVSYPRTNGIDKDNWGPKLVEGSLNLETRWETDRAEISLISLKTTDRVLIQIDYVSNEFGRMGIKEKKKQILKDL
ncbi:hypothetical protein GCM10009117_01630 [Gangjinia marincola]|uniref:Uncharacterized protein n=1 Tax=Gangjinia marincola TaxID=578463 RepID=A0ABP3XNX2_9FLAO